MFCACSADVPSAAICVATLDVTCSPAYEPTYSAIYNNLLSKSCGTPSTGNVCHYGQGARAGLDFSDAQRSYAALLGTDGSPIRVMAGDPECSLLVQRIESADPSFRMPVGREQLSLGERCAVRKWILDGAKP